MRAQLDFDRTAEAPRVELLATRDGQDLITRRVHVAHQRQVLYARFLLDQFRALTALAAARRREA